MKNRIKLIIENEDISYSKFADLLGVERSGISHIINGRNKPSLEIVQKILETFSYINTDWLLFGKGSMKNTKYTEIQGDLFSKKDDKAVETENVKQKKEKINSISEKIIDDSMKKEKIMPSPKDNSQEKIIKKIVILYSDKTFIEYLPE
ncbi:MAG: helix-turn-helix domain-containing protein [Bacteroidales bacterium]|nr:helix-turn-helix domain-containing protein [Bacteroidales bacterium]